MAGTHVALVRGINVSPSTKVAMADLRAVFAEFDDVTTLLNSGNVVFTASTPPDARALEKALAAACGFAPRILVLSAARLREVVAANPFSAIADDPTYLMTTFLEKASAASVPAAVVEPERMEITDAAIYQWCPAGWSKSAVSPTWWKKLGVLATTRNQKTLDKLLAALA